MAWVFEKMQSEGRKFGHYLRQYPILSYAVRALTQPRACRVYCVGAPKTGTHSIERIFRSFRAMHEPGYHEFADLLERRLEGSVTDHELQRVFKRRDWALWLELESSHPLAWFSDILRDLSSNARFILTVRDCYSWLDSIINQHINYTWGEKSTKLRDLYFGGLSEYKFQMLDEMGVYPIRQYLSYWARHNDFVLSEIPEDRLLIIPTQEIKSRVSQIAEFVGLNVSDLDTENTHSYRAPEKHHVLEKLDYQIRSEIEEICGPVIDRLYAYGKLGEYDLVGVPHR